MKSFVYIITNGEDYKVGVSVDPEKRLKQLQTGNSKKLSIVSTFEVSKKVVFAMEKEAHKLICAKYQKSGEWFKGASAFHINLLVDTVYQRFVKEE
jgi:predicted GIY-YIG superfamily endonuclease